MYINSVEHLKTCLRRNGYEIVDQDRQYRDVRPYLVVWHRKSDTMVYVDFRMLANRRTTYYKHPWYRNWLHKILVRRQFRRWLRENRWRGKHRFDVATVFEATEYNDFKPVIDHIVDVKM